VCGVCVFVCVCVCVVCVCVCVCVSVCVCVCVCHLEVSKQGGFSPFRALVPQKKDICDIFNTLTSSI